MTQSKQRLAVILVCILAPASATADNDTKVVDCSAGGSIQEAVGSKAPDRPLTVVVRGTCLEGVAITRDDVSLIGEGGGPTIRGSITVDGARRAVIASLTVSNPAGDGITITNGGSATIRNNHVDDSTGYGLFLRHASFAIVNDNTFLRNGAVNPANADASGIGVAMGSVVRASRNEMSGNLNAGIEVFDNSTYRSEGDTVAGNGRSAVDTFRSSYVDLRDVTAIGQVLVNQQSQLQARNVGPQGSSFTGNINVNQLSFLRLRAGVARHTSALSCNAVTFALCQCDGFLGNACPVVVP